MAHVRFLWSDAWFLTALGFCEGERASLAAVLARSDGIQHAIITRDEVNGALGRLGRGGYLVRSADGRLELTEAGRSLVADSRQARSLLAQQERVERSLAAEPWTEGFDPRRAAEGEAEAVTESEYAGALSRSSV